MKRLVAILATSGALAATGAALAPVAFADPNENANCVGDMASGTQGDKIAHGAQSVHPGAPDLISGLASTDCLSG